MHVAFEAVQIVEHLLFLFRELLGFSAILTRHRTSLRSIAVCLLQLVHELPLFLREFVGTASEVAHLLTGFLLAHAADGIPRFLQTICCPPGLR